jgi:DNA-binding LytR/AlgR family response regulator
MNVLLVDDEELARRRLRRLLASRPDVLVVGEAADGEEALEWLHRASPDVLLLDIRMPGLDGLALARHQRPLPPIVFITAYDVHAVEAFEVNAVDYLLKPVRRERLFAALDRVSERPKRLSIDSERALALLAGETTSTRVITRGVGTMRFYDALKITRFWASEKYTLFLADGEEQVTEEPLAELEKRLAAHGFFRVHRGELVNLGRVKSLVGTGGFHEVELDDGQRVRVSRRMLPGLRTAMRLN